MEKKIRLIEGCLVHAPQRLLISRKNVSDLVCKGVLLPFGDSNEFQWSLNRNFVIGFDFDRNVIDYVQYKENDARNYGDLKSLFYSLLHEHVSVTNLESPTKYPVSAIMTDGDELTVMGHTYVENILYYIVDTRGSNGYELFNAKGKSHTHDESIVRFVVED